MSDATVKILLVEDSDSDALLIQKELLAVPGAIFEITRVPRISEAATKLSEGIFDVCLSDLSLPDSSGLPTISRIRQLAPSLPVVVLTGQQSDALGLEAIRDGVQDYLTKGVDNGRAVARAIRYAIERKRSEEALQKRTKELEKVNKALYESQKAALSLAEDAVGARHEAEKMSLDLLRSREEWVETFNTIPDQIAILDTDHVILRANKALAESLGVSVIELIGRQCFKCLHDLNSPLESCPHDLVLKDGKQHISEIHESRTGKDFLVSVTPVFSDAGTIKGSVHVARDVTESKKRETQLVKLNRTLVALGKSSQEMLRAKNEVEYLRNVCRIIVEDCGHAMVWIGYAENDEGKTVRPVASAGFQEGYLDALNVTWAETERGQGPTGNTIRSGKVTLCRDMLTDPKFAPWREQALEWGYASSVALPLIAEETVFGALNIYSGAPDAFIEDEVKLLEELANDLAHGITGIWMREAQKKAEIELAARAKELSAANKELESFAYSVSHDLRAPLRSIYSFCGMFEEDFSDKLDDTGRDYLGRIISGAKKMNTLIDDIMSLSQVSRHEISLEEVDLSGMAAGILDELQKSQPQRRVSITVAPTLSVTADKRLMEIAVTNLLQNAWKYTGKNETAVIEFASEAGENETVYYIRDNGAGFDMQYAGKLFTAFSRLHKEQDFPGTGIGLAIVNRVIARHGGKIWAEAAPGHGACFRFTIPSPPRKTP